MSILRSLHHTAFLSHASSLITIPQKAIPINLFLDQLFKFVLFVLPFNFSKSKPRDLQKSWKSWFSIRRQKRKLTTRFVSGDSAIDYHDLTSKASQRNIGAVTKNATRVFCLILFKISRLLAITGSALLTTKRSFEPASEESLHSMFCQRTSPTRLDESLRKWK